MSIMKMVYQAGLNNGLSPNQARAFTAEVGRENDFNPSFIFGEHRDSNRDNVGIISWNQGRRRNLYSYLQKRGISTKNGIERSQRSLDAQMGFAIHEIKTNPSYKATKKLFLNNPNVDYRTAEKVLGKNFIRWDYAGDSLGAKVRAHHNKRDKYYAQLGGVVKDGGYQQQAPDPRLSMSAPDLLASLRKGKEKRNDNQIFMELANNNGLAGREINHLLSQGANPQDIAKDLGLNVSVSQPQQEVQVSNALPDIGASYDDFMAGINIQDTNASQLPDIGDGYDDFMSKIQIDEPQQPASQTPDIGSSYDDFMSKLQVDEPQLAQTQQLPDIGNDYDDFMSKLDLAEQPTQAGEPWQTQNSKLESMSQMKNEKVQLTPKSSWELPS